MTRTQTIILILISVALVSTSWVAGCADGPTDTGDDQPPPPSLLVSATNADDILTDEETDNELVKVTIYNGHLRLDAIRFEVAATNETASYEQLWLEGQTGAPVGVEPVPLVVNGDPIDEWNEGETVVVREGHLPATLLDRTGNWPGNGFSIRIVNRTDGTILFSDRIVLEESIQQFAPPRIEPEQIEITAPDPASVVNTTIDIDVWVTTSQNRSVAQARVRLTGCSLSNLSFTDANGHAHFEDLTVELGSTAMVCEITVTLEKSDLKSRTATILVLRRIG